MQLRPPAISFPANPHIPIPPKLPVPPILPIPPFLLFSTPDTKKALADSADSADSADFRRLIFGLRRFGLHRFVGKGSHRFHGKHETRLIRGRDYTDSNRFHGVGPLRVPQRLTQKRLSQIPQIPQIFADRAVTEWEEWELSYRR